MSAVGVVPQPSLLQQLQPRSVLVFRALQIGDLLCAVPALRALRAALPAARIELAGLPWAHDLVQRFPHLLDAFHAFPGYPGLPERVPDASAWPSFVAAMRQHRFDLALQMHGNGSIVNALVAGWGARVVAGFCPGPAPGPGWLTWPDRGSETSRLLSLVEHCGAPSAGPRLDYPLLEADRQELQQSGVARGLLPGAYICLHPGARDPDRRWPPHLFAALGDELQRRYGLPVVITGSGAEHALARQVCDHMQLPALNAAADISVGAMAVLLSGAALLVCNDTGVSHIAAGLRLPSVVIFRASDPERWAPQDTGLHTSVLDPQAHRAEAVFQAACALLDQRRFA